MKRFIKNIVFLLLAAVFVFATSKDSVQKQLEDFNAFNQTLSQKEGRIDLHVPQETINSRLSQLKKQLQSEKSLLEQFKLFSATLSTIQCGHTQIYPNKAVLREWLAERNSLPIDYYLEGRRLIVSKTDPSDYKNVGVKFNRIIKPGAEILTIDHLSVEEMMDDIGQYISSDEDLEEFKYFQASQLFEFFRHMTNPFDKESVHVQYVYGADTNELYLPVGTAPVYTMNYRLLDYAREDKKNSAEFGDFKIIKSKYGYFRFKSFRLSYGKNYDEFLESSFKKMKSRKIDKLVVDLRGNMGGVMQYAFMRYMVGGDVELGRYVVEKPKTFKDSKYIKKFHVDYIKHRRMSKKQRTLKRRGQFHDGLIKTEKIDDDFVFDGQVVVITDEGTFSSAAMLACHLKTLKNAKIVGRTAGGSFYAGNAGTLEVKLPQSGFMLYVNPNTFYSQLPLSDDPKAIKVPDLELNPTHMKESKLDAYYFKNATELFQ